MRLFGDCVLARCVGVFTLGCCRSESAGKDPEMKKERDKILEHVSRIQTFRAEQVEAEGLLNKFLQLKKQAQSQDRDALRMYRANPTTCPCPTPAKISTSISLQRIGNARVVARRL